MSFPRTFNTYRYLSGASVRGTPEVMFSASKWDCMARLVLLFWKERYFRQYGWYGTWPTYLLDLKALQWFLLDTSFPKLAILLPKFFGRLAHWTKHSAELAILLPKFFGRIFFAKFFSNYSWRNSFRIFPMRRKHQPL